MKRPKAPRRDCKKAGVWKDYYLGMAAWYKQTADMFAKNCREAAKMAELEAERFREGVHMIVNKTHPNIVAGKWK